MQASGNSNNWAQRLPFFAGLVCCRPCDNNEVEGKESGKGEAIGVHALPIGTAVGSPSSYPRTEKTGDSISSDLLKERHSLSEDFDRLLDGDASTADTAGGEPPADFAGSWICQAVDGDMDKFLEDMGLNESLRQAARSANYGIGQQIQNIAQAGNSFVVQNIFKEPVTMRFRVGAGLQSSSDQEGKPILIEPRWEGEVLCVTSKLAETGSLIATSRRYFNAHSRMVLELRSPTGFVVQRIFERNEK